MIDFSQIQVPGTSSATSQLPAPVAAQGVPDDPATVRELLLSSPHDLAMLKERNPPLAEALLSGSIGTKQINCRLLRDCCLHAK